MSSTELRLGLQLYGVREACAQDFPGTLKRLAVLGYQGVEFHDLYGHEPAQVRRWLDDAGLVCCGYHQRPFEAFLGPALEGTIDRLLTLGSPYLVLPGPLPEPYSSTVAGFREAVRLIAEAATRARARGLRIGYHNEAREFVPIQGTIPWHLLVRELPEEVFFQLDTGNAAEGGADPMDCLGRVPGRLTTVHLKAFSRRQPNALIGDDELPWADILRYLTMHGRTEWLVLEYESDLHEPMLAMEKSLTAVRGLLA